MCAYEQSCPVCVVRLRTAFVLNVARCQRKQCTIQRIVWYITPVRSYLTVWLRMRSVARNVIWLTWQLQVCESGLSLFLMEGRGNFGIQNQNDRIAVVKGLFRDQYWASWPKVETGKNARERGERTNISAVLSSHLAFVAASRNTTDEGVGRFRWNSWRPSHRDTSLSVCACLFGIVSIVDVWKRKVMRRIFWKRLLTWKCGDMIHRMY